MKIASLNWYTGLPILKLLGSSSLPWSDNLKNYCFNSMLDDHYGKSLKLDK